MAHREFKDRVYGQFARIGSMLASEKRLELLDLLAQAPRNVDALAAETGMSVANTSQHLQSLKTSRLVDADRDGTRMVYRLASDEVLRLWLALRSVGESRLAEVDQLVRTFGVGGDPGERLPRDDLGRLIKRGTAIVVDVRPGVEFEHGHLPKAMSVPLEGLPDEMEGLPRDRKVVVYCRGRYCQFADEAVELLRSAGFDAIRLEGGWPEWLVEGRPVEGRVTAERRPNTRPARSGGPEIAARRRDRLTGVGGRHAG